MGVRNSHTVYSWKTEIQINAPGHLFCHATSAGIFYVTPEFIAANGRTVVDVGFLLSVLLTMR